MASTVDEQSDDDLLDPLTCYFEYKEKELKKGNTTKHIRDNMTDKELIELTDIRYKTKAAKFDGMEVFDTLREKGFICVPQLSKSNILCKYGGLKGPNPEELANINKAYSRGGFTQCLLVHREMIVLDFDLDKANISIFDKEDWEQDEIETFGKKCADVIQCRIGQEFKANFTVTPSGGLHMIMRTKARTSNKVEHKIDVDNDEFFHRYSQIEVKYYVTAAGSLYMPTNMKDIRLKSSFVGNSYIPIGTIFDISELSYIEDTPFAVTTPRGTHFSIDCIRDKWTFEKEEVAIKIGDGKPVMWSEDKCVEMFDFINMDNDSEKCHYNRYFPTANCLVTLLGYNQQSKKLKACIANWIKTREKPESAAKAYSKAMGDAFPEYLLRNAVKNGWQRPEEFDPEKYAAKMNVSLWSDCKHNWGLIMKEARNRVIQYEDIVSTRILFKKMLIDTFAFDINANEWLVKAMHNEEIEYIHMKPKDLKSAFHLSGKKSMPISISVQYTTEAAHDVWKKYRMSTMLKRELKDKDSMNELEEEANKNPIRLDVIDLWDLFGEIELYVKYSSTSRVLRDGVRGTWRDGQPVWLNTYNPYRPIWNEEEKPEAFDRILRLIMLLIGPEEKGNDWYAMTETRRKFEFMGLADPNVSALELLNKPEFETCRWFINWFANVIRGVKTARAPHLYSEQKGTGKSTFMNMLDRSLRNHSFNTGNFATLLYKNSVVENSYLVWDGDGQHTYDGSIMDGLKHLIGDQDIDVNGMCKDLRKSKNKTNCLFISNHPSTIRYEVNNRRFVPIHLEENKEVIKQFATQSLKAWHVYDEGDAEATYFKILRDYADDDEGAVRSIYNGFMNYKPSMQLLAKDTKRVKDLLSDMIIKSLPVVERYLLEGTKEYYDKNGSIPNNNSVYATKLHEDFKGWYVKFMGDTHKPIAPKTFWEKFGAMSCVEKHKRSGMLYSWTWEGANKYFVSKKVIPEPMKFVEED